VVCILQVILDSRLETCAPDGKLRMVDVARLDPALGKAVRSAVRMSFLWRVSRHVRQRMLDISIIQKLQAGCFVSRLGETPMPCVVIEGTVGGYLSSRDDRSINVRLITTGQALGLGELVGVSGPVWLRAVSDCTLLTIGSRTLGEAVAQDPTMARAVCRELAWELSATTEWLADELFSPVKQRVARHLEHIGRGDASIPITHQQLAEGVGTSADVVARALRELRTEGVLETRRNGIHVRRPAVLRQIAQSAVQRPDKSRQEGRQLSLIG